MAKTVTQKIEIKTNAAEVLKQISDLQKKYDELLESKKPKKRGRPSNLSILKKEIDELKKSYKELRDEENKSIKNHSDLQKGIKNLFSKQSFFGNLETLNENRYQKNKLLIGDSAATKSFAKGETMIAVAQMVLNISKKIANTFNNILKDTIGVSLNMKSILNDVVKRVGEALDTQTGIATYSMTSTLFTNRAAREQQMRYGISAGQNYALTQTMALLNMRSEEDLMYMNIQQRAMFQSLMAKYQGWYEQLTENGTLREVQEFQLEFNMFKQKLAMDFLTWFAKNKDAIFNTIKLIANIIMQLTQAVVSLVTSFLGDKSKSSSDAIGVGQFSDQLSYAGTGENKVVNININQSNNVTGVDTNQFDEVFENNNKKLLKEVAIEIGAIS